MRRLRLVVFGIMGGMPLAGLGWQVLHYLEGFRRLGHDVYYVEDTPWWPPYDPQTNTCTDDCRSAVDYIAGLMAWCGLPDRWAYRAGTQGGRIFGLSESQLSHIFEHSDALINLTGSTVLRDEHMRVPVRVYVETDPVLPQIRMAQGDPWYINLLAAHTHHFTYGQNFGAPDCKVPLGRFTYHPTCQPIILDWWASAANGSAGPRFTTIGSWQQSGKDVQWLGETYTWSKHLEFLKFIELPRRSGQSLELALIRADPDAVDLLASYGWRVVDAVALSTTIAPYRDYILGSSGEFTVAKDQNVRLRSGWFSDRSACYLAAGRPVITQDTAFGNILPQGEGLFAFTTMDEILASLEAINSDYARHSAAAYAIAEEYFRAEKVLADLVDRLSI